MQKLVFSVFSFILFLWNLQSPCPWVVVTGKSWHKKLLPNHLHSSYIASIVRTKLIFLEKFSSMVERLIILRVYYDGTSLERALTSSRYSSVTIAWLVIMRPFWCQGFLRWCTLIIWIWWVTYRKNDNILVPKSSYLHEEALPLFLYQMYSFIGPCYIQFFFFWFFPLSIILAEWALGLISTTRATTE